MSLMYALRYAARTKFGAKSRAKGLLRVAGYSLVVTVAAFGYSINGARAGITKTAFQLGEQLRPLTEQANLGEGDVARIQLNGESISVAQARVEKPVKEVLDLYESECNASPSSIGGEWPKASERAKSAARAFSLRKLGTLRSDSGDRGVVMCFVRGSHSKDGALNSIKAFTTTKDLGEIGKLRYAFAMRTPEGRTQVISAWTDDSFNFGNIYPASGEEPPGHDVNGVPRVPNSRRILDSSIAGTSFGLHAYETDVAPEKVIDFYATHFHGSGWTEIVAALPKGAMGRAFTLNNQTFFITANTDPYKNKTLYGIGEMGNPTSHQTVR